MSNFDFWESYTLDEIAIMQGKPETVTNLSDVEGLLPSDIDDDFCDSIMAARNKFCNCEICKK